MDNENKDKVCILIVDDVEANREGAGRQKVAHTP